MANDAIKKGDLIEVYAPDGRAFRGIVGEITESFASDDHKSIQNDKNDDHTLPCFIINMVESDVLKAADAANDEAQ